ncbi:hypothetical protein HaLaN_25327 [Haematococcus lacustris]|uniref:Uncharacterized protein n=1 Tax=Haematococcus lacustris TaxID=44745 RepID=A0A6A0A4C7_HAELA|nr:hypothetical protein HaLaN_25327 [Haematococcus lacustris]
MQAAGHVHRWCAPPQAANVVGRLHVPPGQSYALCARLWNISNAWKSGMMFDVVELKRVQGPEGKAAQGAGGELGLLAGGSAGGAGALSPMAPRLPRRLCRMQ